MRDNDWKRLLFSLAYGARCNCSDDFHGDYCQYETMKKSTKSIPQVDDRVLDMDTLAMLAGLETPSIHQQRAISFAIAMGNRSQFVFCLTNPCENGGSCFVTNTATTKVRRNKLSLHSYEICFSKGICICRDGYVGDYCENLYNKTKHGSRDHAGFCISNPCLNDGTCVEIGIYSGYCRCVPEFRGTYCETSVRSVSCNPSPW